MIMLEKIQGSIFGGAVGDSLGYAVEFLSFDEIIDLYGDKGIKNFRLFDGKSIFSDDTQMSLFTANGLLVWDTMQKLTKEDEDPNTYILEAYREWHKGQVGLDLEEDNKMWLYNYPELIEPRHPGRTIMTSLNTGLNKVDNDSKGCGSLMRISPFGLFFRENDDIYISDLAKNNSLLTHGHPMAYISSSYLAILIKNILMNESSKSLEENILETLKKINILYKSEFFLEEFNKKIKAAIKFAKVDDFDHKIISQIGEGWVAEEALAIAVYSSIKYENNFYKGILCAVNHDGDSDSTGSITGNILGAYLGIKKVLDGFNISNLERYDVLFNIAKDLHDKSPNDLRKNYNYEWVMKYITADFGKNLS